MDVAPQDEAEPQLGIDAGILEAAYRFACARGRPAAVFFLANYEPIGTANVRELAESIGDHEFDDIDIVIHSTGGDIHAAYRLISFLRRRSKAVFACIPLYARSAATLLCVGADCIVLDDLAALGPLDAQVFEGTTDNGRPDYKSALNQFKSLERLREFSLESVRAVAEMLYDRRIQRTEDVLKYSMEFVAATSGPLFEKIESLRLGDYSQALAIGEEYGKRLLKQVPGLTEARREQIVHTLVHGYPSHEYVIDAAELRELGLNATVFEDKERLAARELARYHSTRLVRLVDHRQPPVLDVGDEPGEQLNPDAEPAFHVHSEAIGPAPQNPWRDSVTAKTLPRRT